MNAYLEIFRSRRVAVVCLLGFSSGLPLALTSGTLQAWMTVSGVDLATIGIFTLVGIPYTWKFLWAPTMDRFVPPFLGRRRGWLVVTQVGIVAGLVVGALMVVLAGGRLDVALGVPWPAVVGSPLWMNRARISTRSTASSRGHPMVARSAFAPAGAGCTCGSASPAATSAAATTRPTITRRSTSRRPAIPSSRATTRRRAGGAEARGRDRRAVTTTGDGPVRGGIHSFAPVIPDEVSRLWVTAPPSAQNRPDGWS